MKRYIKKIQKKLTSLKKSRSISRSDDPSFSSSVTSSDSSEPQTVYKNPGSGTPTSVLQKNSNHITNDFVHAFQMMDRGDGKIEKEELRIFLSKIIGEHATEEEIKMMLTEIDRDGDGCISLEELSVIAVALEAEMGGEELREVFDFFDADHDGNISAEELYRVFETLVGHGGCSLDECERMINGVDRNGDGFVCFEDFSRMMELQLGR